MYSESDLNSAVEAGILSRATADAFRDHVATTRASPIADEESFRLLTGFNDIFVTMAMTAALIGIGWLGGAISTVLGALAVAAASWGLAEYFTRVRRMALPSILLLLTFAAGVAGTLFVLVSPTQAGDSPLTASAVAGLTAVAAWLHWRRFQVPITVAAGTGALVAVAISLLLAALPQAQAAIWGILLVAGLLVFAFAMHWDLSDPERRTRRSDVAFWLHLMAAPLIAHSIFKLLGVFAGEISTLMAGVVLLLYAGFAAVALAVDRRALLVSSLIYVLYAIYALFSRAGAVELGAAFTALLIGSALLMLSAFWQPMRAQVVGRLGTLGQRLPPVRIPRTHAPPTIAA